MGSTSQTTTNTASFQDPRELPDSMVIFLVKAGYIVLCKSNYRIAYEWEPSRVNKQVLTNIPLSYDRDFQYRLCHPDFLYDTSF